MESMTEWQDKQTGRKGERPKERKLTVQKISYWISRAKKDFHRSPIRFKRTTYPSFSSYFYSI